MPFSVRRRRFLCVQWQRPTAHAGRRFSCPPPPLRGNMPPEDENTLRNNSSGPAREGRGKLRTARLPRPLRRMGGASPVSFALRQRRGGEICHGTHRSGLRPAQKEGRLVLGAWCGGFRDWLNGFDAGPGRAVSMKPPGGRETRDMRRDARPARLSSHVLSCLTSRVSRPAIVSPCAFPRVLHRHVAVSSKPLDQAPEHPLSAGGGLPARSGPDRRSGNGGLAVRSFNETVRPRPWASFPSAPQEGEM